MPDGKKRADRRPKFTQSKPWGGLASNDSGAARWTGGILPNVGGWRRAITFGAAGILIAGVAFTAGALVDRLGTDSAPVPPVGPSIATTPSPSDRATDCLLALTALQGLRNDASAAYAPANKVQGQSDAAKANTFRTVAANLYVVELRVKSLNVPSELQDVRSLELEFVRSTRETYESAAAAFSGTGGSDTNTLGARAGALYGELGKRLAAFACS